MICVIYLTIFLSFCIGDCFSGKGKYPGVWSCSHMDDLFFPAVFSAWAFIITDDASSA